MEKAFKGLVRILACVLICVTVALAFSIPQHKAANRKLNFYSALELVDSIKDLQMDMTSIIYVKDVDGNWVEYQRLHGDENRIWVDIENIPKILKDAFVAIEDETFYTHSGINWKRTIGAVGNYFFEYDDVKFGGSSITQQLIKNLTKDNDKSAERKVREIVRALIVEKELKKNQILEAYLNTIALGNGINGVQVAANYYFNKDVKDLTISEAACIAAITQNPSKYNPITGLEANNERRKTVITKMYELGFISESEYQIAYNSEIVLDTSREERLEAEINNYFIDALIDEIIIDFTEKFDCNEETASNMLYNGGYKIYATMDTSIQAKMEEVYLNTQRYFNLWGKNTAGETVHAQSAMTILDYNGHIVGIVGGAGEKLVNRGLNRATDAPRQPGSTMKPLGVYTLAIEKNLVVYNSVVVDEPVKRYYPDGRPGPKEWYGDYKGEITLDYAIRKSANTIPVILLNKLGYDASYEFLRDKLRFKHITDLDKNPSSLALGGTIYGITTTESASAYAIFGNGGIYHEPTTYYKIENSDGETVIEYDTAGEQVITSATATVMNRLLQGVVRGSEGTGGGISGYNSMRVYAKTGTSSESKDLWMVAGTPYYVGSVWYGFDKQQQIRSTTAAANIWRDVMREVHRGLEWKDFIYSDEVYASGGGYYKKGTYPDSKVPNNSSSSSSSVSSPNPESSTSEPQQGTTPDENPPDSTGPENTTP